MSINRDTKKKDYNDFVPIYFRLQINQLWTYWLYLSMVSLVAEP